MDAGSGEGGGTAGREGIGKGEWRAWREERERAVGRGLAVDGHWTFGPWLSTFHGYLSNLYRFTEDRLPSLEPVVLEINRE